MTKEFVEVVPGERIVLRHIQAMHTFRMTMAFADEAGGTRLTWRTQFESAAEAERVRSVYPRANEENFDRLGALLGLVGPGGAAVERFALARMSRLILGVTVVLLALPPVLLLIATMNGAPVAAVALLMAGIYAWVWLRFRPTAFIVRPDALDVIWPLKRRSLPRTTISHVQVIDHHELKRRIGFAIRIGAGGLWGGFGSLWTQRRGVLQMYVSREDGVVWIERTDGSPWLITPDDPERFADALRQTVR
jgi:hypothetical protein